MPSLYTGSVLHHSGRVAEEVARVVRVAAACAAHGIGVLVTNPKPIDWSEPVDKDDDQLRLQADALAEIHAGCRGQGVELAYHVHAPEMR